MDFAQAQQHRDHNIVVAHQHVEGAEEPEHHEKKSVMKKVKAKAKKIKDTIAKKVHHDDKSSDSGSEYDDQDDPEIHDAPIYDSATTRSSVFGAPPPVDISPPGPVYEDPKDHGKLDNREKHSLSFGETVTGGGLHAPHDLPTSIPHYNAFTPTTTTTHPGQVEVERETHFNVNNPRNLQEHDHDKMVLDREFHLAPKHDVHDSSGVKGSSFGALRTRPDDLPPPGVTYQDLQNRSSELGKFDSKERHGVNFGESTFVGQGLHAPQNTPAVSFSHRSKDHSPTFVPGRDEHSEEQKFGLDFPKMLEEDPAAARHTLDAIPTTNYQSKVTDPTGKGGEIAGMGPILHSLDRMTIQEKRDAGKEQNFPSESRISSTNQPFSTGSHDQFSTGPTFPGKEQNFPSDTRNSSTNQPFSTGTHGQFSTGPTFPGREQNFPSDTRNSSTNQPFSTGSHDQFSTGPTFPGREQNLSSETHISSTNQPFIAGSRDQFSSGLPTFHEKEQNLSSGTRNASSNLSFSTGSHDQFSPAQQEFASGTHNASTNIPFLDAKRGPSSREVTAPEGYVPENQQPVSGMSNTPEAQDIGIGNATNEGSGITGKISSATSALAGTAVSAKNMVASTIGYGENTSPRSEEKSNQSSYTDKISSATSAIADKAASAKDMVASKIGYGENKSPRDQLLEEDELQKQQSNQSQGGYISSAASAVADKAVAAKNIVASKIGYGDQKTSPRYDTEENLSQSQNQSGYTEKLPEEDEYQKQSSQSQGGYISSAASAVADKAAAAKNIVASKIGYGDQKTSPRYDTEENLSQSQNQSGYTEKISSATSAIVDKAASAKNTVVSTVSGAGSAVMSKIPGVGSGSATGNEARETSETGQNRGGGTVKEYFVEKLRPGEEDKALSDVISGALHKGGEESKPRGKVKESVEVRRRLGPFNEKDEDRVRRGMENAPGTGVADKLYGAVTSWFSKDEEVEKVTEQAKAGSGNDGITSSSNEDAAMRTKVSGERRLQEN